MADPTPDNQPSRIPFSDSPAPPKTWWSTIPGQLTLVAFLIGAIVIGLGLLGLLGPLSQR